MKKERLTRDIFSYLNTNAYAPVEKIASYLGCSQCRALECLQNKAFFRDDNKNWSINPKHRPPAKDLKNLVAELEGVAGRIEPYLTNMERGYLRQISNAVKLRIE